MFRLSQIFTLLLLVALLVSACQPITAAGSGAAQPLDQAALQQAHDQLVGAAGAYGASERVVDFQNQGQKIIGFRGSGESEGQWEDTTYTGQIADALAAIDYLATLPEIDLQRLAVLGFSQGGLVAAETAARDNRVKSVVLWGWLIRRTTLS
jgi:alpha/beta superfamily hydrolase